MAKHSSAIDRMKEIFEIAKNLSSVLDVDTLLKRIDEVSEKLLDAEVSSIMLLDPDGETLSFKVATGEKGGVIKKLKVKVGEGVAGTVAKEKKPIIVNDAAKDPKFTGQTDKASGFVTKSILCVPMFVEKNLLGVMEILNKNDDGEFTDDDVKVLESLAALAAISIHNARAAEDQRNFFVNMIEVLIFAIESRDAKMTGHSWRVAQLSTSIAKHLGLDGPDYKDVYYGALLHDIGLLAVKEGVSLSEGIVTMRDKSPETNHPRAGADLIRNINLLKGAVPVVKHHHENFDGTGYPDNLSGDQIPIGARIVAVAEAVEEMRLSGFSEEKIKQMIKLGQETRFDPQIVGIFLKEFSEASA